MAITNLIIENFKGVGLRKELEIKPLTIFLGSNSAGKSTCIHAITALSQTVKIPNNSKPIVLDDEYAFIHLGRFIDVIHSKSYQDMISIGFNAKIKKLDTPLISKLETDVRCEFSFKSSLRTQDTVIETATICVDEHEFKIVHKKNKYTVSNNINKDLIELDYFGLNNAFYTKGLNKTNLNTFITFSELMSVISNELNKVRYLGPFRQQPQRAYQTFSSIPSEVGAMGESTVSLLTNEIIQSRSREHVSQISEWLRVLKLGSSVDVTRIGKSNMFEIKIETDSNFIIADLGYGMSQVLPVITQCSFAENDSTLLFEQPEIHLHPLAARGLARVFSDIIKKKNCKVVVESHSEEILHETQIIVSEGTLSKDDVAIYKVIRVDGESCFTKLDINDDGEIFDNWRVGFSNVF